MEGEAIVEEIQDENKDIDNIPSFTSEKLADIIVLNRYLGLYDDLAAEAMEELVKRREAGETFEYEAYINENLKNLPKIELKMPQFNSLYNLIKPYIKL